MYYREGVIVCLLLAVVMGLAIWSRAQTFEQRLVAVGAAVLFLVFAVIFAIPKYEKVKVVEEEAA